MKLTQRLQRWREGEGQSASWGIPRAAVGPRCGSNCTMGRDLAAVTGAHRCDISDESDNSDSDKSPSANGFGRFGRGYPFNQVPFEIVPSQPPSKACWNFSSPHSKDTLLYLEGQLQRSLPVSDSPVIAHKAAIDQLPFQLRRSEMALTAPRVRILIADDVGLGKTLEAGILASELVRRGRATESAVWPIGAMTYGAH